MLQAMKTSVPLLVHLLVVATSAIRSRYSAALLTGSRYRDSYYSGSRYPEPVYHPCPFGCRCSSTSPSQHRWQQLLTSYRIRKMTNVSRGPFGATSGSTTVVDSGARMTCMGLQAIPDNIPEGENHCVSSCLTAAICQLAGMHAYGRYG